MNLKLQVMPATERELHEPNAKCRCKPEVVVEYNADYGTMTMTIKHNRLKPTQEPVKCAPNAPDQPRLAGASEPTETKLNKL